jgi:hypothetical protein
VECSEFANNIAAAGCKLTTVFCLQLIADPSLFAGQRNGKTGRIRDSGCKKAAAACTERMNALTVSSVNSMRSIYMQS